MLRVTILLCLLLSGCLPVLNPSPQTLFHRGAEELATGVQPQAFIKLRRLYPDTIWAERASTLNRLAEEERRLTEKVQATEKELARCRREYRLKESEVTRLQEDRERLKQVIIEMERRAR